MLSLFKRKQPDYPVEVLERRGFKQINPELENAAPSAQQSRALKQFYQGLEQLKRREFGKASLSWLDSFRTLPTVTTGLNMLILMHGAGDESACLKIIPELTAAEKDAGVPTPAFVHFCFAEFMEAKGGPAELVLKLWDLAIAAAREDGLPGFEIDLLMRRAALQSDMLQIHEALETIERAFELAPSDKDADWAGLHLLRSKLYGELDRPEDELRELDKAQAVRTAKGLPIDPAVLANCALALHNAGRSDESLATFDAAQRAIKALGHPHSPQVEMNRATVLVRLSRYEDALNSLLLAKRLSDEQDLGPDPFLELNLASTYAYLGQYDKQLELVVSAEAMHSKTGLPPDPRLYDSRADALFHLGKTEEAWQVYEEAQRRYRLLKMDVPPMLYSYAIARAKEWGNETKEREFQRLLAD